MNKNQKLFDEIAKSLNYTKIDDIHYLSDNGCKLRLTKRGFITFTEFKSHKSILGVNTKDFIVSMELEKEFWQL